MPKTFMKTPKRIQKYHDYNTPMHRHILFDDMLQALNTIINEMPDCGCGRYYKDRHRPDPTCHRHAWLTDYEVQVLKNIHANATLFKEKAP